MKGFCDPPNENELLWKSWVIQKGLFCISFHIYMFSYLKMHFIHSIFLHDCFRYVKLNAFILVVQLVKLIIYHRFIIQRLIETSISTLWNHVKYQFYSVLVVYAHFYSAYTNAGTSENNFCLACMEVKQCNAT